VYRRVSTDYTDRLSTDYTDSTDFSERKLLKAFPERDDL
jgi:hypothetical protein